MLGKRTTGNGERPHKPEGTVTKLWQAGVLVGQGMARVDAIREVRIAEQNHRPLTQAVWRYRNRSTEGAKLGQQNRAAGCRRERHIQVSWS